MIISGIFCSELQDEHGTSQDQVAKILAIMMMLELSTKTIYLIRRQKELENIHEK